VIVAPDASSWQVTSATLSNALFKGAPVADGTTTYHIQGLPAGTYYFQSDSHPLEMNGVLVVGG